MTQQPLHIDQPYNILTFLSLFSPMVVITFITSLSFVFQNFKGFIYLGFLLAATLLRHYVYYVNGAIPLQRDRTICTSVQYSQYGNATFSVFTFAFSMMYMFLPMFLNGAANYWIFTAMMTYAVADILVKANSHCFAAGGWSEVAINVLSGAAIAAGIVMAMYGGNSSKYLFFNEMNTGTESYSVPKNQQMKCRVYRNGELVSK